MQLSGEMSRNWGYEHRLRNHRERLDALLPWFFCKWCRKARPSLRLNSGKLFAVVRCVLKKPELAEEALQEAFIKVWQRAASYEAGSLRPTAWLAAIARNQAIDLKRRFAERMSARAEELEVADSMPVMPEAELAMDLSRLEKCLKLLPEECQDMVLLAYYQGWTRDELAVQYKRPATTIKTLLRRSLTVLKDCLDG